MKKAICRICQKKMEKMKHSVFSSFFWCSYCGSLLNTKNTQFAFPGTCRYLFSEATIKLGFSAISKEELDDIGRKR